VCHNYKIEAKYSYVCSACGGRVARHSKSIAAGEVCRGCGVGAMVLERQGGGGGGGGGGPAGGAAAAAHAPPRTQSKYLAYVEQERARVGVELPGLGPRETMREIARRWAAFKARAAADPAEGLVERLERFSLVSIDA
jgi:DNA-directed RNA polymerase subunit RPC12/RpoP